MNTILLIILYNKNFHESLTLESLLRSSYSGDLLIFNNGPSELDLNDSFILELNNKFKFVELCQDIKNRPLSVIYNDFVTNYNYDQYLFFDDDTRITDQFLTAKNNCLTDISLPIIRSISDEQIYYPLINNKICQRECVLSGNEEVISIGSGLMVSSNLIKKFKTAGITLFDERYSLYGVDFSFFRRIKFLKEKHIDISIEVSGLLNHSLSRVDNVESKLRTRERSIDVVLTKILYPSRNRVMDILSIFKVFIQCFIRKDFSWVLVLLKVVIDKAHPRSLLFFEKNKKHF